jgi:acyl-coenzyme A synthetase/AMP-(fatty) acid ligase
MATNFSPFSGKDQSDDAQGLPLNSGIVNGSDAGARPFVMGPGGIRTRGQLWADVASLAECLPERDHVINLCADRYLFCLTLLAAWTRGQTCLLPSSGQPGELGALLDEFPRTYLACDRDGFTAPAPVFRVATPEPVDEGEMPEFDHERAAVIAFTSGSTGRPKPCRHGFETFQTSTAMALNALGWDQQCALMVSTTPPQHMYGLETSIFWPLFSGLVLYPGRPFFPEDVRRTVRAASLPCILATTPTHLSALARTAGEWSNLAAILCSTSGLSLDLARQAEMVCGAPLFELYGSTETLSFAWRRTVHESIWSPYAGVRLQDEAGVTRLLAPHLPAPVVLEDSLKVQADGRFTHLGRGSDMVKIAGKRGSLADLNRRLQAVEGVRDGLFHCREDALGEARLVAVVVGEVGRNELIAALRPHVDEVFLPRRVYRVDAIPRNEAGKVVREEWLALLASLGWSESSESP